MTQITIVEVNAGAIAIVEVTAPSGVPAVDVTIQDNPFTIVEVNLPGVQGPQGQSGASTGFFTDLVDTPASYVGQASKVVQVNAAATALEFGVVLATTYQPLDTDLTAIAALTTTAYGRSLLTLADAAALAAQAQTPWVQDIDADGFDLRELGVLVLNHSADISAFVSSSVTPTFQKNGTGTNSAAASFSQWTNNTISPKIIFAKSRGGSVGTQTIIQAGDTLGEILFEGSDGTDFASGASIRAVASSNASAGNNDMPTALVFGTTANAASTPTDRWFIDEVGALSTLGTAATVEASRIPKLQLFHTNADESSLLLARLGAANNPPRLFMLKSRGASVGSYVIVNDADQLGEIRWLGDDGTDYGTIAGDIVGTVDGAPSANIIPMRIDLRTRNLAGAIAARWSVRADGTWEPGADATYDIGTSTVGINDLHFGLGGIVNFDGGDVLLTHSANTLTLSGGILAVPNLSTVNSLPLNLTDAGFDVLVGWDDSASQVKNFALADLTTEAAPAAGDYVIIYGAEGDVRKTDWSGIGGSFSPPQNVDEGVIFRWSDSPQSTVLGFGGQPGGLYTDFDLYMNSNQRIVIGHESVSNHFDNNHTPTVILHGLNGNASTFAAACYGTNASSFPLLVLARSRGTTLGSMTVVASGDLLGKISFQGADGGTNFEEAATITCVVDAAAGTDDMPGAILINTTADGAHAPTARWRFNSSGHIIPEAADTYDIGSAAAPVANLFVTDEVYGAGWNGSLEVPTKNALWDKIETLASGSFTQPASIDEGPIFYWSDSPQSVVLGFDSDAIYSDFGLWLGGAVNFDAGGDSEFRPSFQVTGTAGKDAAFGISRFSTAGEPRIMFGRSRGTLPGSFTIVQNGDNLGELSWAGADGSDFAIAAKIIGGVDGTPGNSDMPGSLSFCTTADGANDTTLRWVMNSSGHFVPGADATYDIGTSAVGINDLHFGLAGIINFDGGDVTITHSANTLTVAGASGGVLFPFNADTGFVAIDVNNTNTGAAAGAGINVKSGTVYVELSAYHVGGWAALETEAGDLRIGTEAGDDLFFRTNDTIRWTVDGTAGDLTAAAGVHLITTDEAYGVGWNGNFEVPTKNALYDKIETLSAGSFSPPVAIDEGVLFTWSDSPAEALLSMEDGDFEFARNVRFDDGFGIRSTEVNNPALLLFTSEASAVNYITITNAATGDGPVIAVAGSDTDASLNLYAKGDGAIEFLVPAAAALDDFNLVAKFSAGCAGTPDVGFGARFRFAMDNSVNAKADASWFGSYWVNPTDGAEVSAFRVSPTGDDTGLDVFGVVNGVNYLTITNAATGNSPTFDVGGENVPIAFAKDITVPDEAYGVGWNGSLEAPTKNALYDKIETLSAGSFSPPVAIDEGVLFTWSDSPAEVLLSMEDGDFEFGRNIRFQNETNGIADANGNLILTFSTDFDTGVVESPSMDRPSRGYLELSRLLRDEGEEFEGPNFQEYIKFACRGIAQDVSVNGYNLWFETTDDANDDSGVFFGPYLPGTEDGPLFGKFNFDHNDGSCFFGLQNGDGAINWGMNNQAAGAFMKFEGPDAEIFEIANLRGDLSFGAGVDPNDSEEALPRWIISATDGRLIGWDALGTGAVRIVADSGGSDCILELKAQGGENVIVVANDDGEGKFRVANGTDNVNFQFLASATTAQLGSEGGIFRIGTADAFDLQFRTDDDGSGGIRWTVDALLGDLIATDGIHIQFADGIAITGKATDSPGHTDPILGVESTGDGVNYMTVGNADFGMVPFLRPEGIAGIGFKDCFIELDEITAPSAPGANRARFFVQDNGSGLTQICAIGPGGTIVPVVTLD
jgi:hypothetical protein